MIQPEPSFPARDPEPLHLEQAMGPAPARRRRWILPAIVASAIVLVLTAVAVAYLVGRESAQPGTVASQGPPADGGRYDSPQALIAELERHGITCRGYDETRDAIGAVARGSCYVDGEEVVVSVYATAADAQAHPRMAAGMLAGVDDVDMVVGVNWTLNCPTQSMAERVAQAIGGQVVHDPA